MSDLLKIKPCIQTREDGTPYVSRLVSVDTCKFSYYPGTSEGHFICKVGNNHTGVTVSLNSRDQSTPFSYSSSHFSEKEVKEHLENLKAALLLYEHQKTVCEQLTGLNQAFQSQFPEPR